jgi:hypothetical protein
MVRSFKLRTAVILLKIFNKTVFKTLKIDYPVRNYRLLESLEKQ